MANPNLQKIIKLTSTQYDLLSNGGSITHQGITYTGLNDNYLYLIQEDSPDIPVITSADKGKYLYTNSSTGALEWTNVLKGSSATITATDNNPAKLTLKGHSSGSYHPGGVTLQTSSTNSTTANTITVPAKNGTMALTSDLDNYVKLTGDQTINGTKTFSGKIINTYLQQGIIDTHPENNGTIISYYTNDLGYLFERGGSCVAKNITQNKTITVPADVFDCSPSYWYLTLTNTSDVVQIIIKASSTYYYNTRGGIGFGAGAWRAKDVKIEVGYSATNTGTAASPDSDIVWITKINVTNQTEGLVSGMITGPHASEGGKSNDDCEWSYMRLTLTNWATIYPRIAQIFSITYNSRGLHNTFLSKNGGYVYGNILPSNNNRYLGNGSENWAAVYARYFYENGKSLADKYAAKTHAHDYLPLSGGTLTGNLYFKEISNGTFPVSSSAIIWKGSTDGATIYYRLDASDTGRLVFQTADDTNCNFIWSNSVSGDLMELTGAGKLSLNGSATITASDSNPAKLTLKGKSNSSYHPGGVTLQTSSTDSTAANTITVPAKDGIMALTNDLDNYTKKSIKLSDNVDLNTVTSSGFYRLMNHTQANFPHGQMIVCRGDDTIAQLVFPYADTKMYVRTGNPFNTSGGLWHDWKQVAFTDHTHTSINTAFVFNNNDMPEGSANLSATTNAHQISFYRNGLSVPYQMDNSNDGGILRCRGNSESNVILELATWDDSGAGETIQFNYYPTNSQVTPTYSVTVPKKTGTILLTTDSSSAGNAEANKVVARNDAGSIQTEKLAVSSGTTTKATMQYNSTEDCIEFIFA